MIKVYKFGLESYEMLSKIKVLVKECFPKKGDVLKKLGVRKDHD